MGGARRGGFKGGGTPAGGESAPLHSRAAKYLQLLFINAPLAIEHFKRERGASGRPQAGARRAYEQMLPASAARPAARRRQHAVEAARKGHGAVRRGGNLGSPALSTRGMAGGPRSERKRAKRTAAAEGEDPREPRASPASGEGRGSPRGQRPRGERVLCAIGLRSRQPRERIIRVFYHSRFPFL